MRRRWDRLGRRKNGRWSSRRAISLLGGLPYRYIFDPTWYVDGGMGVDRGGSVTVVGCLHTKEAG